MTQGYSGLTLNRAKSLRRAATTAERAMWEVVRGSRLGVRFRRQQPIGPFIADFYCSEHALIVEVDGAQHDDDPSIDARRTSWLEQRGYRVIRFSNREVLGDVEGVMRAIIGAFPHPAASRHPSPSRGEGV